MKTVVFIMAGGSGTRLAPLSLTIPGAFPKQFLSLIGNTTLLQEAITRVPEGNVTVVIPEKKYEAEVFRQAKIIGKKIVCLSEPFGCNTAACIMLGTFSVLGWFDENTVLFFMPADHIMNKNLFQNLFNTATKLAFDTEKIVTLGITPTRPETGYGYIHIKKSDAAHKEVLQFKEKPDIETAKQYVASGEYYWNAGIFAFKAKTMIAAMQRDAPVIYKELNAIKNTLMQENIASKYNLIKQQKQNISIDYAVMEKEAANLLLVPAPKELEWNDVGGWIALEKYLTKDADGNLVSKPVKFENCRNNTVLNYSYKRIKMNGCENILVVMTDNGILVSNKASYTRAKEIIPGIENKKTVEFLDSKSVTVNNSTGTYIGIIDLNDLGVYYNGNTLEIVNNKI